ncbi:hypothetical protein ABT090_19215 [Streptomyces asoensis]|uniref:hypothetical protein n=1 Tax=Streptomyces asoensis TaxID=249586 RepID=UPI0033270EAF
MSVHTSAPPYPHLLAWFTAGTPDTAAITRELTAMAEHGHLTRLLTALRLHGEIAAFRSALQVAFPQLDLAAPKFQDPRQNLQVLNGDGLKTVGAACLAAIGNGTPEPAFDAKLLTSDDNGLFYAGVPVFATVDGVRRRVFVSGGKIHITSADHVLKGWLQRQDADVTVQQIHGVEPDAQESGYNALEAAGNLVWTCSFGKLDTPVDIIRAIARSDAFGEINWGVSYCTAAWVSSLMPTLSTKGTVRLPGGTVTIGQNVHSGVVMGSAWVQGMDKLDCKQAQFPQAWSLGVTGVLCARAAQHAELKTITTFCGYLKAKFASQDQAPKAELERRIEYLVTAYPQQKEALRRLPKIQEYYSRFF